MVDGCSGRQIDPRWQPGVSDLQQVEAETASSAQLYSIMYQRCRGRLANDQGCVGSRLDSLCFSAGVFCYFPSAHLNPAGHQSSVCLSSSSSSFVCCVDVTSLCFTSSLVSAPLVLDSLSCPSLVQTVLPRSASADVDWS